MNITNSDECLEEWEREFIRTGDDSLIPEEDRERVLHEVDQLYNEMYDILILVGVTPQLI